jgi:HEAT repeat protein
VTWLEADPAADARYRALDALPVVEGSVPALVDGLSDVNWRVRRLAVERLSALPPSLELARRLVGLLSARDETGARNAAAAVLAQLGVAVLPEVTALLRHADPDQRKFAAEILSALGLPEAVAPLVRALDDADANVRTAVAEALGVLGGPDARRALERLLDSPDVMLRVCALEGLARLAAPPALPALLPLAADPLTRRSAWKLLVQVDHPAAVLLAARGLAQESSRDAVLSALGARGAALSAEAHIVFGAALRPIADGATWLVGALGAAEAPRRRGALLIARALAVEGLALAVAGAVREDADAPLALQALLALGGRGVAELLAAPMALADLSAGARAVVAEAVVQLAEPAHVAALVALVDAGEPELAELAVRALAQTRSPQAIGPLVRLLEDDALAMHAARGLVALAACWPEEVRAALHPLVAGRVRPHVVRAWAAVAGPRAAELVRRALNDRDEAVRAAAAEASVHVPKETAPTVRAAMLDESAAVRRAAVRALPSLPVGEAAPLLARGLDDVEPVVLAAACEMAAALGASQEAPRLEALVRAPEAPVALAALDALATLGLLSGEVVLRAAAHPQPEVLRDALLLGAAQPLLVERALSALGHTRWDVRVAAARALAASGGPAALGPLQDALAREVDDVARRSLAAALATLTRRV